MKTMIRILAMIIINAATIGPAEAQMSQYKFNQIFQQAFSAVLTGDHVQAIPLLEQLNEADDSHHQVSFLLAMSYLKTEGSYTEAARLLEHAVKGYDAYHQYGRVEDRTAPPKAWFFLAEAYVLSHRYADAVTAYRTYMTTIPFASIEDKRALIAKMEKARSLVSVLKVEDATDVELFAKAKL